jgi:hypothetical protein
MIKKKCKMCQLELPTTRYYWLGYFKKKCGQKAYSSYCNSCNSKRVHPSRKGEYKPHINIRGNKDIREEIIIDNRSIYLLLKRIEINSLKMSYIDSFKLVSFYVDVFANDIADYYCEIEQLDIMYYKLKKYIKEN